MIDSEIVKNIIQALVESSDMATTHWIPLKRDSQNRQWALVFAWSDGFEDEGESNFIRHDCRICGKIAYNNSYMKEFDIDWIMPSNINEDEVIDTNVAIEKYDDLPDVIEFWESNWNSIQKELNI